METFSLMQKLFNDSVIKNIANGKIIFSNDKKRIILVNAFDTFRFPLINNLLNDRVVEGTTGLGKPM